MPPKLMGILNVTPDSFYDGGKYNRKERAVQRAEQMIAEGAHYIDVGGESTRPGSAPVSLQDELQRVIPIVKELVLRFPKIPISVDTQKSAVAYLAYKKALLFLTTSPRYFRMKK